MLSTMNTSSYDDKMSNEQYTQWNNERMTLLHHGYTRDKFITQTLQGDVFTAKNKENKSVVIKKTNKNLHYKGISIANGRIYNVKENIVKEANIMKQFMINKPPNSCIKYYDFLQDNENFYLVMENGGESLFEFIVNCHRLIQSNQLSLQYWRQIVRYIFAQMVQFIYWMHHKMHACNLDISLENILISKYANLNEKTRQVNNCSIKFIDFGLTEVFNKINNPKYKCNKYVGKVGYQSPQISNRNEFFYANKADIWSLAVCLFMMLLGTAPYRESNDNDNLFAKIKAGDIESILLEWNVRHYVSNDVLDLLQKMLCYDETKRIDIYGVAKHKWLKPYFQTRIL